MRLKKIIYNDDTTGPEEGATLFGAEENRRAALAPKIQAEMNQAEIEAARITADNALETAGDAKDIADATKQYFWADGNGVHVTSEPNNPESTRNTLWNSLGMLFRKGANNLLAIVTGTNPGVEIYDGQGNTQEHRKAIFKRFVALGNFDTDVLNPLDNRIYLGTATETKEKYIEVGDDGIGFTNGSYTGLIGLTSAGIEVSDNIISTGDAVVHDTETLTPIWYSDAQSVTMSVTPTDRAAIASLPITHITNYEPIAVTWFDISNASGGGGAGDVCVRAARIDWDPDNHTGNVKIELRNLGTANASIEVSAGVLYVYEEE